MAKLKTNKSLAKRIEITGSGKFKTKKPGTRHLNAKKSVAQRARKNKKRVLSDVTRKFAIKALPGVSSK